jgi:guanylate kinase
MGCAGSRAEALISKEKILKLTQGCVYIKPLVMVGPSGTGKKTLFEHLRKHHGEKLQFSV